VRLDKPLAFTGRDALLAERDAGGPAERLRCIVLDDPRAVCLGGEPVRVAGATAGRVTSGRYGHRVERSIAYAYLPAAGSEHGARVEVDVFATRVGASVVSEPIWDPDNGRIR
jgi:glycine cleavage system aminomethyltransferase T